MTTTSNEPAPEVAEGLYRLGTRWVNFYLVADGVEYTLIDAGYPGYWKFLTAALDFLGTSPEAISSHASPGFYRRSLVHRSGLGFVAHSAVNGGAKYRPVQSVESLKEEEATGGLPRAIEMTREAG